MFGQGPGRRKMGEFEKFWERGTYKDIPVWSRNVKIFISHTNQRIPTMEGVLNDQIDEVTRQWTSDSLLLVTQVLAQWTYKQSSDGARDGNFARAQQHGDPITQADVATTTNVKEQRPTLSLQHGAIFLRR